MTCQEMTQKIKTISIEVQDFEAEWAKESKNAPRLLELKDKLQKTIDEIKKELPPESVWINGKEFPVQTLEIGGLTKDELQAKLNEVCLRADGKVNILQDAQGMLDVIYQTEEFQKRSQNPEKILTIRLKVSELGFTENPTVDQIYARAQESGLEFCPAETGPYLRLQDTDQPFGEWYRIAMKMLDRNSLPCVFTLGRDSNGFWLSSNWALPTDGRSLGDELIFSLRPSAPLGAGEKGNK